ncbi:MAG: hypothetical protein ABI197_01520 [Granulicella sp.]
MAAEQKSSAKLMVAYRLHFEPATLDTIDKVRSGQLGIVHLYASTFAQPVDPINRRAHSGKLASPVFYMHHYPVNASRYIFGDGPKEVASAAGKEGPLRSCRSRRHRTRRHDAGSQAHRELGEHGFNPDENELIPRHKE